MMAWFRFLRKKFTSSKQYFVRRLTRRRVHSRLYHFPTSIAVFGAPGAGKTTVTRNFSQKHYPDDFQKVTEIYKITITTKATDGVSCKHDLSVHDTPGNLRGTFPDLYESVIRKSDAFILVFSLNDPVSLTVISRTLHDLYNIKGDQVPVMIVANKCDLASEDADSVQDRFQFYRNVAKHDHPIIEVSAKCPENFKQHWVPLLVELERRQGIREIDCPTVYLDDEVIPRAKVKRRHTIR